MRCLFTVLTVTILVVFWTAVMPSQSQYVKCRCEECLPSHLNGRLFVSSQLKAHLAGVQARAREHEQAMESQATILGLMDEGPDIEQPSTLWNSRHAIQQDVIVPQLDTSPTVLLDDVMAAINRLTLSDLPFQSDQTPNEVPLHCLLNVFKDKQEHSWHTTKALERLRAIESRVTQCAIQLTTLTVDEPLLATVEHEIGIFHATLARITWSMPSIDMLRTSIREAIDKVDARAIELRILNPHSESDEPVLYNTGK